MRTATAPPGGDDIGGLGVFRSARETLTVVPPLLARAGRIKSSSGTWPASDTAGVDTPVGTAEPVMRWSTARR